MASAGGCLPGEVRTGEIRHNPVGLGTLWVRCPAAAGRKIALAGHLVVGWTRVLVDALKARSLQCYRCLELRHVRQRCTSTVDRSGRCYMCGEAGHRASTCTAQPKCLVCSDQGKPATHRLGTQACSAASAGLGAGQKRRRGTRGRIAAVTESSQDPTPAAAPAAADTAAAASPVVAARNAASPVSGAGAADSQTPTVSAKDGGALGPMETA
nr:PREDICTED: uncharacterized protein LOC105663797 [Megachile rotundata]